MQIIFCVLTETHFYICMHILAYFIIMYTYLYHFD